MLDGGGGLSKYTHFFFRHGNDDANDDITIALFICSVLGIENAFK